MFIQYFLQIAAKSWVLPSSICFNIADEMKATLSVVHYIAPCWSHAVAVVWPGAYQGGTRDFCPWKLPKLDLTADAEYVANFSKCRYVVVNVQQCNLLHGCVIMPFFLLISQAVTGEELVKFILPKWNPGYTTVYGAYWRLFGPMLSV